MVLKRIELKKRDCARRQLKGSNLVKPIEVTPRLRSHYVGIEFILKRLDITKNVNISQKGSYPSLV